MTSKFGRTALWVWITIAMAVVAFAAVQDLPEGEGKAVLESKCASCHTLDQVTSAHNDRDTWKGVVEKMRDKPAGPKDLSDDDIKVLADYLAKNFGPADSNKPGGEGQSDAQVKEMVEMACSSCHGMDIVSATGMDKGGWTGVLESMVAMGAQFSDDQIPVIVDYLVKTYPPDAK